jgi:hypothetical protein
MKTHVGSGCIDPRFLNLCISWRRVCQLHAPAALPPGERAPGTNWIGGWVGPRAGLDNMEERKFLTLQGLELQFLCRPSRSQSQYRLSFRDS